MSYGLLNCIELGFNLVQKHKDRKEEKKEKEKQAKEDAKKQEELEAELNKIRNQGKESKWIADYLRALSTSDIDNVGIRQIASFSSDGHMGTPSPSVRKRKATDRNVLPH